ncbi:MAG: prolyl oligopeptidase family serine peptidase [Synechococcales bacterium]|nr:prolyl oligopeptidase family serine peptidase [Synechococcales bacterium]
MSSTSNADLSNSPIPELGLTWQSPPAPIAQMLDAAPIPNVAISPNQRWLVEFERPELLPIAELAEPEIGLAGFRLNPRLSCPARMNPYRRLWVRSLEAGAERGEARSISLPDNARINFLHWSPSGDRLAFTLLEATGLALWVLDLPSGRTWQVTEAILNGTYGTPLRWLSDETLLCKVLDSDRGDPPQANLVPVGPIVQENLGKKSPSRTYTNLLQTPHDEDLLDYYITAALEIISLEGDRQRIVPPCRIDEALPSPDCRYILLTTLHRPYSYKLPAGFFPRRFEVIDLTGQSVYTVTEVPLIDNLSTKFDAVRTGRRGISWRSDRGSTLYWIEALDGGEPTQAAEQRDRLLELPAPFTAEPRALWTCEFRFRRICWGKDDLAMVWERWHDTRQIRMWRINPLDPTQTPVLLSDRSYEDNYSDPGLPLMKKGEQGWNVMHLTPDQQSIYFTGRGVSPAGVHPFLDRWNYQTGAVERLWQCQDPYYEWIEELLNDEATEFITQRQAQTEPPNYWRYDWRHGVDRPPQILTQYPDPAPQFAGIQEEIVRYERSDGVQLSAKLYLPAGYDPQRDGNLPMLFWVYPEEFKSAKLAGQVTTPRNRFSRPHYGSILFLLTQGYGVLDNPGLPIIGEGDTEPNDTYVEQLIAGAKAAIDFVVERGIGDRDRIGIGGHSYGAFTTVNLLAHTDLFRLGIARSGAYNRTLTPFGFQGEQRNFWEATQTYIEMSPFAQADQITAPLLLIHGGDDSNPGTYPVQTERLFEALKGLGGTVRYVVLPKEDHGYRSREAVGHVLWEMVNWCDRYL